MAKPVGEGGGPPSGGPPGPSPYPWAGRVVVVRDDEGHQTSIHSDSQGDVTQVDVSVESSTPQIDSARDRAGPTSARGGEAWRRPRRRSNPAGGERRRLRMSTSVAAVVLVLGIVAAVSARRMADGVRAPGAPVQVVSSHFLVSAPPPGHVCAPRSVLIRWVLRGVRPGTVTTVKVTGAGPIQQFDAPVGADGSTVRVSMSLPAPSKANAEVIAVDGKSVRAPVVNPASAITLAC